MSVWSVRRTDRKVLWRPSVREHGSIICIQKQLVVFLEKKCHGEYGDLCIFPHHPCGLFFQRFREDERFASNVDAVTTTDYKMGGIFFRPQCYKVNAKRRFWHRCRRRRRPPPGRQGKGGRERGPKLLSFPYCVEFVLFLLHSNTIGFIWASLFCWRRNDNLSAYV